MALSSKQWKWTLALVGLAIVVGSVAATGYLVRALAVEERAKVSRWLEAQRFLNEMTDEEAAVCDVTLYTEVLQANTTIPTILTTPTGQVTGARNFGERRDTNLAYLAAVVRELEAGGFEPIKNVDQWVYYEESRLLRALRYFPFIQLALVGAFVVLGYLALSAVRRAEQNRVWVGLAKETAHQLGTPISAIMAWVEYLRAEYTDDAELSGVADELTRDVDRLQLVADRFNKIGSAPELTPAPVGEVVDAVYAYMSTRAPRKVNFAVEADAAGAAARVRVNRHLFEWVLENLIRNALDAMDGSGTLRMRVATTAKYAQIEVQDSGKGIPASRHKTVFEPGYTTKSRGWGLGLSLAKRIVEEYHGGRIFVKESAAGRGSTFAVRLPLA